MLLISCRLMKNVRFRTVSIWLLHTVYEFCSVYGFKRRDRFEDGLEDGEEEGYQEAAEAEAVLHGTSHL